MFHTLRLEQHADEAVQRRTGFRQQRDFKHKDLNTTLTGSAFALHTQPSVVFLAFEVSLAPRSLDASNLKYENQLDDVSQRMLQLLVWARSLKMI